MPRLTSRAAVALVALVAVAPLAVAACGGAPSGSPSGASASPAAVTSPTAAPPTEAATAEPTPAATPEPTAEPTAAATPGPTSAFPDGATCRNEAGGITVTYPAAWHAYADDARWTCLLFDPDPIIVPVDSELPDVAVAVFPIEETFASVVAESRDATFWNVLRTAATTIDGLPARVVEADSTGEGFLQAGLRRYVIVVDRGARGVLLIETIDEPGAAYEADRAMLDLMARAIDID